MREWSAEEIARAAGAQVDSATEEDDAGPARAVIDSRAAGPCDLFAGLPGERVDGGTFAAQALDQGAWGVLVAPEHADALGRDGSGVVLGADDSLAALLRLSTGWRRYLGGQFIGVTCSTG